MAKGTFILSELDSGEMQIAINERTIVGHPGQVMDQVIHSFFADAAQMREFGADKSDTTTQNSFFNFFNMIADAEAADSNLAPPVYSLLDAQADMEIPPNLQNLRSAQVEPNAAARVNPIEPAPARPTFKEKVKSFMTRVNKERKGFASNKDLLFLAGWGATAASCLLFAPACLAALSLMVGVTVAHFIYNTLRKSAMRKQVDRCEEEVDKKLYEKGLIEEKIIGPL